MRACAPPWSSSAPPCTPCCAARSSSGTCQAVYSSWAGSTGEDDAETGTCGFWTVIYPRHVGSGQLLLVLRGECISASGQLVISWSATGVPMALAVIRWSPQCRSNMVWNAGSDVSVYLPRAHCAAPDARVHHVQQQSYQIVVANTLAASEFGGGTAATQQHAMSPRVPESSKAPARQHRPSSKALVTWSWA